MLGEQKEDLFLARNRKKKGEREIRHARRRDLEATPERHRTENIDPTPCRSREIAAQEGCTSGARTAKMEYRFLVTWEYRRVD